MHARLSVLLALSTALGLAVSACGTASPTREVRPLRVVSEQAVKGFTFPESVACDARAGVLYVSEFGSELKPLEKDGKGRISRVSPTGQILDRQFLPAAGVLNKPKGSWVVGARLWVTDIDSVWLFDLGTRQGRRVALPGSQFANDLAVAGNVLYVSDNRADRIFRVEPADFLRSSGEPRVTVALEGKSVNPNGIYPGRDGSLLMVGFVAPDQPRGIYALSPGGELRTLARDLGRLDGVYQLDDGSLLITEWNSGSLLHWSAGGTQTLAKGFKGPADFCVMPQGGELLVVVPDLVGSDLRLVRLAR